ncbi:MAG: hypothetical protein R3F37_11290 [Candidatus Competibacteraceae bacterium]
MMTHLANTDGNEEALVATWQELDDFELSSVSKTTCQVIVGCMSATLRRT